VNLPHRVTTIEPAVTTDRRDDTQLDYGDAATRVADVPAWMQQTGQTETYSDRDERVTALTMFSDSTPTLTALARIEWNGATYRVNGRPNHRETPAGYHHSEVPLVLVEG
jgi:hypothetical protein